MAAGVQREAQPRTVGGRAVMNHIYWRAGRCPWPSCRERLRWGVLIIIGFILTYALCYNIWSSFAFPFYLDYLHYTKDQVAFASKVFGIFMTMIGISLGGYLFGRIGRFPTVLIGAAVTPLGNLLYADLAEGGANIDAFTHALRLNNLAAGCWERTTAWCGCWSPSVTRTSQPASPSPPSSPISPASSARSSPRSNTRCSRR